MLTEEHRLQALDRLEIIDTESESEYDELVSLAARMCSVPLGAIAFITSDRQWLKSAKGLNYSSTPRSIAVCDHTIRQDGPLIVEDLAQDARFTNSPLVKSAKPLRFYAGYPLRVSTGHAVGTLCVMDHAPRVLTEDQTEGLRILAAQVAVRLDLREKQKLLERNFADVATAHAESLRVGQRFDRFMDSGPFLAYMKDADGKMLYYNQALARRFGVRRQDFLGKTDAELWPADLAMEYRAHDLEVLQRGTLTVSTERTKNDDGSYATWQSFKFPCLSDSGELTLGGVSIDITEQLAREAELLRVQRELEQANLLLQTIAGTDALTGLPIRRVFEERLRIAFREAHTAQRPLTLLMLDVDNFKAHNDTWGHQHGDAVLQAVASCLRRISRPTDLVTRYGGEEFSILAENTDEAGAVCLADRILMTVRDLRVDRRQVTISIGVAQANDMVKNTFGLIEAADQALFAAKRKGKNRVEVAQF